MKKIKILFLLLILLWFKQSFASFIPIENIFTDIDSNYKYYYELRDLYNRQAIYPDSDNKFNPQRLLTRDEFVSISMEVSCTKCTKPNASLDLINKYQDKTIFFDLDNSSKYSYCIASANDNDFIKWYYPWDKCQDWSFKAWEIPFCPNNNILLEEAIALVLRDSNIFTIEDNNKVIEEIRSWNIKENLSTDVWAKNSDWSPYTFYWYLRKALSYSIEEYDQNWNKKTYNLLELDASWKINPKKYITKEEFLKMAYIVLKTNSCKNTLENNLSLQMEISDKVCSKYEEDCRNYAITWNEDTYDFKAYSSWACDKWIKEENWYVWKFYNINTQEQVIKYWKYLDNYKFSSNWVWEVYLNVLDNCWDSWEVYNTLLIDLNISNSTWTYKALDTSIYATPISWTSPLSVNFTSIVWGWKWEYKYFWDFWDSQNWNWKNTSHIYDQNWVYKAMLFSYDEDWKVWKASILIKVVDSWDDKNCQNKDNDNDWVNDCEDLCQNIKWDPINKWCPVVKYCDANCECPKWEICSENTKPQCANQWVCIKDFDENQKLNSTEECLRKLNKEFIFWNVVCNSCPCANFIDFFANLRQCDLVFPSINSPEWSQIYSAWPSYEYK